MSLFCSSFRGEHGPLGSSGESGETYQALELELQAFIVELAYELGFCLTF